MRPKSLNYQLKPPVFGFDDFKLKEQIRHTFLG